MTLQDPKTSTTFYLKVLLYFDYFKNYDVSAGTYEFMHENEEMNINEMFGSNPIHTLIEMQSMPDFFCEIFLKPKSFQNLLDYPKDFKFDLIIIDVTMGSCFYPLIHRFHYPPTIAVTPFLLPSYVAYNFGNQVNPSYLPWHSLPYTGEMTFMERVSNFLLVYVEVGLRYVHQYRQEHKVARKYFGEDIPSMVELERHMSLILTNSDPVLDFPQPLAPNFIPVGGLHTRKAKKLPDVCLWYHHSKIFYMLLLGFAKPRGRCQKRRHCFFARKQHTLGQIRRKRPTNPSECLQQNPGNGSVEI